MGELSYYLKEIDKYKALGLQEELILGKRMSCGDIEAREKLIKHNLIFVVDFAKKYRCGILPFIDLIQEGNLGLIEATDKYNFMKGCSLNHYAKGPIRNSITKAIGEAYKMVRFGKHRWTKSNRIKYFMAKGCSLEEISMQMGDARRGCSKKDIKKLMIMSEETYLDDPISHSNGDYTLLEITSDHRYNQKHNEDFLQEYLSPIVERLPPTQLFIIKELFGLGGKGKYTQEEIGTTQLNLTKARIGQIEKKGIKNLRQMPEIKELRYQSR